MNWILTLKFPKKKGYKVGQPKEIGNCPTRATCTDKNGCHHSCKISAPTLDEAKQVAKEVCHYLGADHVTRIELLIDWTECTTPKF